MRPFRLSVRQYALGLLAHVDQWTLCTAYRVESPLSAPSEVNPDVGLVRHVVILRLVFEDLPNPTDTVSLNTSSHSALT